MRGAIHGPILDQIHVFGSRYLLDPISGLHGFGGDGQRRCAGQRLNIPGERFDRCQLCARVLGRGEGRSRMCRVLIMFFILSLFWLLLSFGVRCGCYQLPPPPQMLLSLSRPFPFSIEFIRFCRSCRFKYDGPSTASSPELFS
jgi:hypothetical protein